MSETSKELATLAAELIEQSNTLSVGNAGDTAFNVATTACSAAAAIPIFGWMIAAGCGVAKAVKAGVDAATGHNDPPETPAQKKKAAAHKKAILEATKKAHEHEHSVELKLDTHVKDLTATLLKKEVVAETTEKARLNLQKQALEQEKQQEAIRNNEINREVSDEKADHTRNVLIVAGVGLTAIMVVLYGVSTK